MGTRLKRINRAARTAVEHFLTTETFDAWMRVIVFISIALSLFFSFQELATAHQVQSNTSCLKSYIAFNNAVAGQDRAVVDQLVTTISSAKSATDTRAALATYITQRHQNDRLRAANPFHC